MKLKYNHIVYVFVAFECDVTLITKLQLEATVTINCKSITSVTMFFFRIVSRDLNLHIRLFGSVSTYRYQYEMFCNFATTEVSPW